MHSPSVCLSVSTHKALNQSFGSLDEPVSPHIARCTFEAMLFVRPPETLYVAPRHRGPLQHGVAGDHLVNRYLHGSRFENALPYNGLRKLAIDHDNGETSSVIQLFTTSVHTKKVSDSEIGNPTNIGVKAPIATWVQPIITVENVPPRIALNRVVERAAVFHDRLLNMHTPAPVLRAMAVADHLLAAFPFEKRDVLAEQPVARRPVAYQVTGYQLPGIALLGKEAPQTRNLTRNTCIQHTPSLPQVLINLAVRRPRETLGVLRPPTCLRLALSDAASLHNPELVVETGAVHYAAPAKHILRQRPKGCTRGTLGPLLVGALVR